MKPRHFIFSILCVAVAALLGAAIPVSGQSVPQILGPAVPATAAWQAYQQVGSYLAATTRPAPPALGWEMINGCLNQPYSINRWADVGHNASGFYSAGGSTAFTYSPHGYPVGTGIRAMSNLGMLGCPAGTYSVTWEGTNVALSFQLSGGASWKQAGPNSGTLTLPAECVLAPTQWGPQPTESGFLIVSNSDLAAPLDHLHIWEPGYGPGSPHAGQEYDDRYLSLLKPFAGYRAMNDLSTSNNPPTGWAQRVIPDQWDQTSFGVNHELVIELAIEARFKRLWVCVPFGADPDYVKQMADLYHAKLPPGIQLIVEYSNENWNWGFPFRGTLYATEQANQAAYNGFGLAQTNDPNWLDARVAAEQARAVALAFKARYADRPDDLKCVFCGQATWNLWIDSGLGWLTAKYGGHPFDSLGIAPYYGYGLNAPTLDAAYSTLTTWMTDGTAANSGLVWQITQHTALADRYRVPDGVEDYEGDQHLFATTLADGNTLDPNSVTYQFQLDPRTGCIQDLYFAVLHRYGIKAHCSFAFLESDWNKYGFWPVLRNYEDHTPRWDALQRECLRSN